MMAIAVASFTACGNQKTKGGETSAAEDSVAYALGLSQSQQFQQALVQMGVDSAYVDEFLKGMEVGAQGAGDKKKDAYNKGLMAGVQMSMYLKQNVNPQLFGQDSTKSISVDKFMEGFNAGAKNKKGGMTIEQAQTLLQKDIPLIQARNAEKTYGANKKASDDFMARTAKQADVKKLDKGVYYKVLKEGTGKTPTAQDVVKINYEGKTVDGKVFDTNWGKEPTPMPVGQVIPGFTEALTHMPVGSTWEVYIPYTAAYNAQPMADKIKPFSALIFKITLVDIEQSNQPKAAKPASVK